MGRSLYASINKSTEEPVSTSIKNQVASPRSTSALNTINSINTSSTLSNSNYNNYDKTLKNLTDRSDVSVTLTTKPSSISASNSVAGNLVDVVEITKVIPKTSTSYSNKSIDYNDSESNKLSNNIASQRLKVYPTPSKTRYEDSNSSSQYPVVTSVNSRTSYANSSGTTNSVNILPRTIPSKNISSQSYPKTSSASPDVRTSSPSVVPTKEPSNPTEFWALIDKTVEDNILTPDPLAEPPESGFANYCKTNKDAVHASSSSPGNSNDGSYSRVRNTYGHTSILEELRISKLQNSMNNNKPPVSRFDSSRSEILSNTSSLMRGNSMSTKDDKIVVLVDDRNRTKETLDRTSTASNSNSSSSSVYTFQNSLQADGSRDGDSTPLLQRKRKKIEANSHNKKVSKKTFRILFLGAL